MVVLANLVSLLDARCSEQREVVAQVVTAVAADGAAREIFAADGAYEHRSGTEGACLFNIFAQIFLIGSAGSGAAIVGGIGLGLVAYALVVGFNLVAVHAVVLLVVVCKLYQHVVAGLYLLLGLLIETLAARATLGTVVHRYSGGEKLLEHLSPAARNGCRLAVCGHR